MTAISVIGYIAYVLTTCAFIPQVYKTLKSRSAKDLSLVTLLSFFVGAVLWFIYAYTIRDTYLVISNSALAVCSGIILLVKLTTKKS